MKTLNITFTDSEYETLKNIKLEEGVTWHGLMVRLVFYKGFYDETHLLGEKEDVQ